ELKSPSRSVQQRIESPSASDVIGLEFRDEKLELCGSMLTRLANTRPSRRRKCPWITGITHAYRKWWGLRKARNAKRNEAGKQQDRYTQWSHRSSSFKLIRLSGVILFSKWLVSRQIAGLYALKAASDGAFVATWITAHALTMAQSAPWPVFSQRVLGFC